MNTGAYLTVITAIIAAYLTYSNQLRLRAFELFLGRRDAVLKDTEEYIEKLNTIWDAIESGASDDEVRKYVRGVFNESLVLFHKAKGAKFGGTADVMLDTFLHCAQEPPINKALGKETDFVDWINRTTGCLATFYGFAHRRVTEEVEMVAFTMLGRFKRKYMARIKIEKNDNDEGKTSTNKALNQT